jgi:hypothetical protein
MTVVIINETRLKFWCCGEDDLFVALTSPVFTNSGNSVHVKNCGLGAQKLDFKNHY